MSNRPQSWISAAAYAEIRRCSTRHACRELRKAYQDGPTDGGRLIVRKVKARGGPGGVRYEVLLDGLTPDQQATYRNRYGRMFEQPVVEPETAAPINAVPVSAGTGDGGWERRLEMIGPALPLPARSPERGAAVAAIATSTGQSERSIRRWIRDYEAGGIAGLKRCPRADIGRSRTIISRAWDKAVPFDQATKERIAAKLRKRIRSLWAEGAPGWRQVAQLAISYLIKLTHEAGLGLSDAEMKRLCTPPRSFVIRERKYEIIAVKDKDAKGFFDRQPRIRRDHGALKPVDLVIGDVHPVDISCLREDGSTQPLRLVGWLDAANNRFLGHLLFPEKGRGVRMAHVAASFAHMVLEWGLPGALYLDNGGEYNWAEFAADAMALTKVYTGSEGERSIVKALPYNAPAKKIESIFAVLERGPFAMMPGWIGGDRMAKKTQNVGKAPTPFPGSQKELWDAIQGAIAYYNDTPQQGELAGRSPNQVYAEQVKAGFRPIAADMDRLQTVFARSETRRVRQGAFRLDGRYFTHDELCRRPDLDRVQVRVPVFGEPMRVAVYDDRGAFVCHAEEDLPYHPMDAEGARESARRKRLAAQGVEDLRRDTEPVDLPASMAAFIALNPPPAAPEPDGVIDLSPELERETHDRRALGQCPKRSERHKAPEPDWFDLALEAKNKRTA